MRKYKTPFNIEKGILTLKLNTVNLVNKDHPKCGPNIQVVIYAGSINMESIPLGTCKKTSGGFYIQVAFRAGFIVYGINPLEKSTIDQAH